MDRDDFVSSSADSFVLEVLMLGFVILSATEFSGSKDFDHNFLISLCLSPIREKI
jgi:hypothetical protein